MTWTLNPRETAQPAPHIRLLVALRFFATGHFQMTDGDLMQLHQATVCRIVHSVSKAIAKRRSHFIQFPSDTTAVMEQKRSFYNENGFPGVIGLIDCTHIKIKSPGGDSAEVHRNRKGIFSINVMMVCDYSMKFTNIVARWPGSTHDARIYTSSRLSCTMETADGILLGDSGFPCLPHLMTPILNPVTDPERKYNRSLIATRIKIERAFGVWKQRFRCLSIPMRTRLDNTLVIIVAVACLHNLAVARSNTVTTENEVHEALSTGLGSQQSTTGRAVRLNIVNQYFT